MNSKSDYEVQHLIQFLKEELERIINQYPRQMGNSILNESQAFAIWFLHQEIGLSYEEANKCVLDESDDGGVDFIWIDKENKSILIGQVEYDSKNWSRNPANEKKAIQTFNKFVNFLDEGKLPDSLHDSAKNSWREARMFLTQQNFDLRYIYVTPKIFGDVQKDRIREKTHLQNYDFFTYDELIERGEEFIDGQTGMNSFKLSINKQPLVLNYDFGRVFVTPINLKVIHKIVELHEKQNRLKALFASNVRSYLNVKKRSKEIASAIRDTIIHQPDRFLVKNNGITIQCSKAIPNDDHIFLERASISNGCQTVMNINRFFQENEGANPKSEVLVTVIELPKDAASINSEIAIARNFQNPVDNRDLMSNHPQLVTLHHRLFAEKLKGSEKRYYLLRKQGEKQVVIKEESDAKWRYFWIDADQLARAIAAVVRQEPTISVQGTHDIFGKYFTKIFPQVSDPSHNMCKYAFWLVRMVSKSYDSKKKWKGKRDSQIKLQKDFKKPAEWIVSALIASQLKTHFSFGDIMEKRFVEMCEKYTYGKWSDQIEDFEYYLFEMIDHAFRLLHAISKTLLGKKLPKAKAEYTFYEDLFKGPNYDEIVKQIKKGSMISYQNRLKKQMGYFVELLDEV